MRKDENGAKWCHCALSSKRWGWECGAAASTEHAAACEYSCSLQASLDPETVDYTYRSSNPRNLNSFSDRALLEEQYVRSLCPYDGTSRGGYDAIPGESTLPSLILTP